MKDLIIVRGGGDLATGTIYKLKKCASIPIEVSEWAIHDPGLLPHIGLVVEAYFLLILMFYENSF